MNTLSKVYAEKVDAIILKIQQEFELFKECSYDCDFIIQEEKNYILSCEKLIVHYLKKIRHKILSGHMKPWRTSGDVKISIFSGTCDYPTMAHLLLMLDNLADESITSDFLVVFLETDENNKPNKYNNFDTRERLIKILIEPFGELIRYFNYGKDLKYFDVVCKLMNQDYPEAKKWVQIVGSDVFNKYNHVFASETKYWKENFCNKGVGNNEFEFTYCIYNRGETSCYITQEDLEIFSEDNKICTLLRASALDKHLSEFTKSKNQYLSATSFKKSLLRVAYPSIVNVLYAGYQLTPKRYQSKQDEKSFTNS